MSYARCALDVTSQCRHARSQVRGGEDGARDDGVGQKCCHHSSTLGVNLSSVVQGPRARLQSQSTHHEAQARKDLQAPHGGLRPGIRVPATLPGPR